MFGGNQVFTKSFFFFFKSSEHQFELKIVNIDIYKFFCC